VTVVCNGREIQQIIERGGRALTFQYSNGNISQGNPTIFEYEPTFNRLTKITDVLNQITRFTYDPATGNLLTATDPLNHTTTVGYNAFGQPISVTDALAHTTTFEYDAVGNLAVTTDPVGNKTQRLRCGKSTHWADRSPRQEHTVYL